MKKPHVNPILYLAFLMFCHNFSKAQLQQSSNSYMVINSGTYMVTTNGLTNTATANDAISGSGTLRLSGGDFTNNAASGSLLSGTSTKVEFTGTSSQSVNGSNSVYFYNLTINKSSGTVNVSNSNIFVSNTLTMTSGNIDLGSKDLTLEASASISGAGSSSYIVTSGTGVLKKKYSSTGSFTFPVGDASNYSPFTFDLISGSIGSAAWVSMKVSNSCLPELSSTSYVNRNWTLDQSGIGGLIAYDCNYTYVQGDVVGNEADLLPTKSSSGTVYQASSGVNTNTNTVTPPTQGTFSVFGARDIADGAQPLPVELLSFGVESDKQSIDLFWTTVSEINSMEFQIQRSVDAEHFETIAVKAAAGNSNTIINYNYKDYDVKPGITYYYRLKQVDFDGKFDLSDIRTGQIADNNEFTVNVYPNPASNYISINSNSDQLLDIMVLDAKGQIILHKEKQNQHSIISLHELTKGVYILQISNNDVFKSVRIIKQ